VNTYASDCQETLAANILDKTLGAMQTRDANK